VSWLRLLASHHGGSGLPPRSVRVGLVVDKIALGQVSSSLLQFYPVSIIPLERHAHISSGGWTIDSLVAAVQRHNLTPLMWLVIDIISAHMCNVNYTLILRLRDEWHMLYSVSELTLTLKYKEMDLPSSIMSGCIFFYQHVTLK
jgi:hypothetical protein